MLVTCFRRRFCAQFQLDSHRFHCLRCCWYGKSPRNGSGGRGRGRGRNHHNSKRKSKKSENANSPPKMSALSDEEVFIQFGQLLRSGSAEALELHGQFSSEAITESELLIRARVLLQNQNKGEMVRKLLNFTTSDNEADTDSSVEARAACEAKISLVSVSEIEEAAIAAATKSISLKNKKKDEER